MSFVSRGKAFASNAAAAAASGATAAKNSAAAAASSARVKANGAAASAAAAANSGKFSATGAAATAAAAVSSAKVTASGATARAKTSVSAVATAARNSVSRNSNKQEDVNEPLLAQAASGSSSSSVAQESSGPFSEDSRSHVTGGALPSTSGPPPAPPPPVDITLPRILFAAVSRDDKVLAEVTAAGGSPHLDKARALGQKMIKRSVPPGWDEISAGQLRSIRMPVHDIEGVTCYTISFMNTFPGDRAQAFVQKLALMLGPIIDRGNGQASNKSTMELALKPVLERELKNGNSGDQTSMIQNQIHETKAMMLQNVEMMLDRQERVQDLEDKSKNFEQASQAFNKGARQVRRFHLMNQVKFGVTVGAGVTLAAAVVAVPIVLAVAL